MERHAQSICNMAELRERPDLVMHLLKLVGPESQVWDKVVSAGTQIARGKRDGHLGLELTKVVGPNTQKGQKLLGILLQIVDRARRHRIGGTRREVPESATLHEVTFHRSSCSMG